MTLSAPSGRIRRRRPHQLERSDRVQRVDCGADTREGYGRGDEEQQRGSGIPRPRLRHGGQRGVLDNGKLRELCTLIVRQCSLLLSHVGGGAGLEYFQLVLGLKHVSVVKRWGGVFALFIYHRFSVGVGEGDHCCLGRTTFVASYHMQ